MMETMESADKVFRITLKVTDERVILTIRVRVTPEESGTEAGLTGYAILRYDRLDPAAPTSERVWIVNSEVDRLEGDYRTAIELLLSKTVRKAASNSGLTNVILERGDDFSAVVERLRAGLGVASVLNGTVEVLKRVRAGHNPAVSADQRHAAAASLTGAFTFHGVIDEEGQSLLITLKDEVLVQTAQALLVISWVEEGVKAHIGIVSQDPEDTRVGKLLALCIPLVVAVKRVETTLSTERLATFANQFSRLPD